MNFVEDNSDQVKKELQKQSTKRKPQNDNSLNHHVSIAEEHKETFPPLNLEEHEDLPIVTHKAKIRTASKKKLKNCRSQSLIDTLLETKNRKTKLDSINDREPINTANKVKSTWIKKPALTTRHRKSSAKETKSSLKSQQKRSFRRKIHDGEVHSDVAGSISCTESMPSISTLPPMSSSQMSMTQSVKDLINLNKTDTFEDYASETKFLVEAKIPTQWKKLCWLREKLRQAKVKRLSQFTEKHKLCFFSDEEIGEGFHSPIHFIEGEGSEYEDEWLEYTGSDTSYDQDIVEHENSNKKINELKLHEESYNLLKSLQSYFLILQIFGRMPFTIQKDEESKCIKFRVIKSWNYFLFCITTTLLTIVTGLLITGCMQTYFVHSSYDNLHESVEKLILDKYWLPGLVSSFSMVQLVLWSFSVIFNDSVYLEEYLSRWHLALSAIKYSPDETVKSYLHREYYAFLIYALMTTLLFFFGGEYFTMFRGNAELIAINVFKQFITQPRFHKLFYIMHIAGHIIFLYCVFCSRLITMMILVHCKLTESAARKFNLRLACVLEKIAIVKKDETFVIKTRVIPYLKLFSEHIVITTFSRHTGRVFSFPATFYFLLTGIVLYLNLRNIGLNYVLAFPEKNETRVEHLPDGVDEILITFQYFDKPTAQILNNFFMVGQCLTSFMVSSEIINKCGVVIMAAYYFVRRHGMLLCRSSNERRFILSMQNSYGPVNNYYIDFGFRVDRPFIYKFLSGIICLLIITIRFSSVRLQNQSITHCNNGICKQVSFPKYYARRIGQLYRNATL